MNEHAPLLEAAFKWLAAAIAAIFAFFFRRHLTEYDNHKAAFAALKEKVVTREELKEIVGQMRDDRWRMHAENKADLNYIRERVDTLADRE